MESENHLMRRVFFLRWYFGFQLECELGILNPLFMSSPRRILRDTGLREVVLASPSGTCETEPLHCLWAPAHYVPFPFDAQYFQQGKRHNSSGPAVVKKRVLSIVPDEYTTIAFVNLPGGERVEVMQTYYKEGKQVPSF
jgi:hypothetical protein